MTIKTIGIKEFRQNITTIWKNAQKKKIKYIVMYHAQPILEVTPIDKKTNALEKLAADIAEARAQVKRGEVYTQEEIMKEFGVI